MQFNINSIFLKSFFRYDGIEFIGAFRKLKKRQLWCNYNNSKSSNSSSSKGFFGAIAGILSEGTAVLHGKKSRRRNGCARFLNFNIDE